MATTELREQLQSLSIPKDRRPRGGDGRASRLGLGRIVVVLLFVAVLAGGFVAYTNREKLSGWAPSVSERVVAAVSSVPEVATFLVRVHSSQGVPPVLTATGKIVSDHRVEVQTKVSGQIVELRFEQGDRVELGQVLARIEDVNYRARRDEAAALVEKSAAHLEFQEFEYERISNLMRSDRATDKEMALARANLGQARAQLAADRAALEWAEKALRDTEVVAPISGVVLERNVEVGDFVAAEGGRGAIANAKFASIADMSKLRVEIDISELDIARVRPGMRCVIIPDAYKDRKYHGHVLWIDPGANYAKATVQAKVRIDQPDDYLRVEGAAQVQFLGDEPPDSAGSPRQPAPWIPASAIKPDEQDASSGTVYVVAGGRVAATRIKLGRQQGGQVEALEGLVDGQAIVARDIAALSDGQRVKTP